MSFPGDAHLTWSSSPSSVTRSTSLRRFLLWLFWQFKSHKWTITRRYQTYMLCFAATKLNIQLPTLIVKGDFNRARLKQVMPNFHQHVTCLTRKDNTLDHCYNLFKGGYKAISPPAFRKSDCAAILLTPEYKQTLLQEAPMMREVRCWTSQSEAMMQDALGGIDWDIFQTTGGHHHPHGNNLNFSKPETLLRLDCSHLSKHGALRR